MFCSMVFCGIKKKRNTCKCYVQCSGFQCNQLCIALTLLESAINFVNNPCLPEIGLNGRSIQNWDVLSTFHCETIITKCKEEYFAVTKWFINLGLIEFFKKICD